MCDQENLETLLHYVDNIIEKEDFESSHLHNLKAGSPSSDRFFPRTKQQRPRSVRATRRPAHSAGGGPRGGGRKASLALASAYVGNSCIDHQLIKIAKIHF